MRDAGFDCVVFMVQQTHVKYLRSFQDKQMCFHHRLLRASFCAKSLRDNEISYILVNELMQKELLY